MKYHKASTVPENAICIKNLQRIQVKNCTVPCNSGSNDRKFISLSNLTQSLTTKAISLLKGNFESPTRCVHLRAPCDYDPQAWRRKEGWLVPFLAALYVQLYVRPPLTAVRTDSRLERGI